MIARHLETTLRQAAAQFPVVSVTGPRQSGKTTLVPVEAKSGQTTATDFFRDLEYWRGLPGQADCPAALVYGGGTSYTHRNVAVISWAHWG